MRIYLLSAVSLFALSSGRAWAAEVVAPPGDAVVEEVVVTGEKAERSLQDTLTSVSVTTARKIERENIQTLHDIIDRTANLSQTYGPSGFTIRGVSNRTVSGGGNGDLATIYVDGAALPEQAVFSGPLDMWDVGQVEILRGPQSTIQGRNALAGAVVIRSADPTWTWGGKARAQVAGGGQRSLAFAAGGPLVADQVAVRLAAEVKHSDGFVYNPIRHEDANATDSVSLRGKLLITPQAVPDLRILATYAHDHRDTGYQFSYARTDRPDYFDNRIDLSNDPNETRTTTDIFTVEASYKLGERLTLNGVASWNQVDYDAAYDVDLGPTSSSYASQKVRPETFSQELRLNYAGDRLSGLIGLYHAKREENLLAASRTNVALPTATLISVLRGSFGLDATTATNAVNLYFTALPVIPVDYSSVGPTTVETSAVFADGAFDLTQKLSVIAGFRYDREQNDIRASQVTTFAGTYPTPSAYGALAPVITGLNQIVAYQVSLANSTSPPGSRTFSAFLPKLGVKYTWTDALSTAFVIQRGYRSGGSSVNSARASVAPYDPEFTWNYEASLRSSWLDGRLTLNANAFYVDWTDQQVFVNLGLNAYDSQTENAGKSHLYGFEVEMNHRVDEHFDWYASLGHTRTKFDDFKILNGTSSTDLAGAEFAYSPHWTASAGATWRSGEGFFANLNANYRAATYDATGVTAQTVKTIDARVLVNTKLGWETARWSAFVFASNLFNEHYVQYRREDMPVALAGDPRVVGAVLEARW